VLARSLSSGFGEKSHRQFSEKIRERQSPVKKNNLAHFGQETNLKNPILHNKFQIASSEATLNHSRQFLAARSGKQKLISVRQKKLIKNLETISLDFLQQHFCRLLAHITGQAGTERIFDRTNRIFRTSFLMKNLETISLDFLQQHFAGGWVQIKVTFAAMFANTALQADPYSGA